MGKHKIGYSFPNQRERVSHKRRDHKIREGISYNKISPFYCYFTLLDEIEGNLFIAFMSA